MADITKCTGENCEKKEKYYRFLAEDDKYKQSYCYFKNENVKECVEFWEIKNDNIVLQKRAK